MSVEEKGKLLYFLFEVKDTHRFQFQSKYIVIKESVEFFIGVVDAQLFKTIHLKMENTNSY